MSALAAKYLAPCHNHPWSSKFEALARFVNDTVEREHTALDRIRRKIYKTPDECTHEAWIEFLYGFAKRVQGETWPEKTNQQCLEEKIWEEFKELRKWRKEKCLPKWKKVLTWWEEAKRKSG